MAMQVEIMMPALLLMSAYLQHGHRFAHASKECFSSTSFLNDIVEPNGWNRPFLSGNDMSFDAITQGGPSGKCHVVNDTAFCNHQKLKMIPNDLPKSITHLYLRNNLIPSIDNDSLSMYPQLIRLDLSRNLITRLYIDSFFGLSQLKYLNLHFNNLTYARETFPSGVFAHLKSLTVLVISKNNPDPEKRGLEYPDEELSTLTSLTRLSMDGLKYPRFGSGFGYLTSLTLVSLSGYNFGYCHMSGLDNDTFINLRHVKCLYMIGCFLQGKNIHRGAFNHLNRLVKLDLTGNEDIGMEHLPNVSFGFRNTTALKYLGLHRIVPRYSLGICVSNTSLQFFPSSIEHLDAQENSIEAINKGAVQFLPSNLQTLDLSGNMFVFGKSLLALQDMKNLQTLKLNGPSFTYELPKNYPFWPTSHLFSTSHDVINCRQNCQEDYTHDQDEPLVLKLPPNLKTLEMKNAGLVYRLTEFHVHENNSLRVLNLTGNRFPSLEGNLTGLHSLEYLDLSSCFVNEMKSEFFNDLPSLEYLNLRSNSLGDFMSTKESNTVFSRLHNLRELDLTSNRIDKMGKRIFSHLKKLERLDLSHNIMHGFTHNISHMHNLQFLNISHTHTQSLKEHIRNVVDKLLRNKVPIRIDMTFTPILCECDNLDFITWMARSQAFDRRFLNYTCIYNDFRREVVRDGYNETILILNRKCTSHVYLLVVVSSSVTLVVAVVCVSICYRFRWNLRYLYHVAYLHYKKDNKRSRGQEFEFDIFVCYANEDHNFVLDVLEPELTRRGLKLYVHGRDFVAGEYISSNIVKAVCRSRKTLVVLTPNMLKSSWCNYEIQMANMEAMHSGRKVLIFLLKGSFSKLQDNVEIFYNIQTNTYLEYPPVDDSNEEHLQALWEKLSCDAKD